jgi:hypothetical protein
MFFFCTEEGRRWGVRINFDLASWERSRNKKQDCTTSLPALHETMKMPACRFQNKIPEMSNRKG